ncbi:alkaline phosphatase D family protein [Tritonibacter mobilis]|uniref:alkaline phosphatase D family protein n=1 Tax=Tritonibacter mobilis TaxID=379347 RepID=UPI0008068795|nr:alkaline phosphatase D family protein [Tritonibacter mobilis]GLP86069.1 metallophosphatase [Tritonibacter mobilis]SDW94576.1 PhoD-like phosphatase [Tritonibacter mobilis]
MTVEFEAARLGPILYYRGLKGDALQVAAMVLLPIGEEPDLLEAGDAQHAPKLLREIGRNAIWRYDFTLTQSNGTYHLGDQSYSVQTDLTGDMRIAFASCNGEEEGDLDRDQEERNLMWAHMCDAHRRAPFALLLQGGDQIYADEATQGHPLSEAWPDKADRPRNAEELEDLADHLRQRFAERYVQALFGEAPRWIMARVPTLAIWDDHDICDGWGSLYRSKTYSEVGQCLYRVAREMYLLFQHAAVEADIPDLFLDKTGTSLSWQRALPGVTLLAPDLRAERGRRQVMGAYGWSATEAMEPGTEHTFLISSVPLLGPRLSLVEGLMMMIPTMQKYEDDLRDQWQSRAHRDEWVRMLKQVLKWRETAPVTVLSGEIHLATRAEMGPDEMRVHQLVASGIAHRAPPQGYARSLGTLAGLGDAPVSGHPIRIHPLPGQKHRYTAERNYLELRRTGGTWHAVWHLEDSGDTEPMALE